MQRNRPTVNFSQVGGTWRRVNTHYADVNVKYVSDKGTLTLCKKRQRTNGRAPDSYLMLDGEQYVSGMFFQESNGTTSRYWGDLKSPEGGKQSIDIFLNGDELSIFRR